MTLMVAKMLLKTLDDDNDTVPDVNDNCPTGELGWTSTPANDYDTDGCRDLSEDPDDDNDGIDRC